MLHNATLKGIATAVPPHLLRQNDVVAAAREIFGSRSRDFDRLAPVFTNAGIDERYSSAPIDWYRTPRTWSEKNGLYLSSALDLLEAATVAALADARLQPEDVDSIVVVSSTGIATPSLDALLMERLPFRRDVQRLPVFGLGCAGGVMGLSRAATLARAEPGSTVLLLVVELCALAFRYDDLGKSSLVATALFGDGAAAAVIRSDSGGAGPQLEHSGEFTWPASLDIMGWKIDDAGFGVIFSQSIPTLVRDRFGAAATDFLARNGLSFDDLDGVICHPGGAKVVGALEDVFGLPVGTLSEEREVLRLYGNMSAATVLFVLHRRLRAGLRGRYLVTALGPGFTAAFMLLNF